MTDDIETLRELIACYPAMDALTRIDTHAALDRLQARVAEMEEEIDAYRMDGYAAAEAVKSAEVDRDSLRAKLESAERMYKSAASRADSISYDLVETSAKLERAKETLEPFAKFAERREKAWVNKPNDGAFYGEIEQGHNLTHGDFRRARAALSELSADAPTRRRASAADADQR